MTLFFSYSEIREVPDNQEVFHHQKTDQSIMFDILEYQDQVHGNEAIKYLEYLGNSASFFIKFKFSSCSSSEEMDN